MEVAMHYSLKPIDQQVIVITGASSGIGMATAAVAAARGAYLVLAARSEQALKQLVADLETNGCQAIMVVADVSKREDVQRIAAEAMQRFGRIDTWVNNAGVSIYGRIPQVAEEDARRLFDVNFWGVVHGSLVALPYLKDRGGALINVGSEVSEAVVPLQGFYSASKHAVKGFTDALRVELLEERAPVSVTLIQPTATNTPFPEHAKNYMDKEPKLPSPQIEPRKVAEAICDAAEKPVRDVRVGALSKLNTTTAKLMPGVGDWMAQKQVNTQSYEAPPVDPDGTLFKPGEAGRIKGRPPEARA
jgi:short-subunit dehydrogenase